MAASCARCFDQEATAGVLCAECSNELETCPGLLPEHIVSRLGDAVDAWLIDTWGQTHPVVAAGISIGRGTEGDLGVLHESVSREHARLGASDREWTVRDLGSKNGTLVDLVRVQGRAAVADGAILQVGKASFAFVTGERSMRTIPPRTLATATASRSAIFRCALQCPRSGRELQLVSVAEGTGGPGVVLFKDQGSRAWSEMNLTPLEFQLIRALAERLRSAQRAAAPYGEPHYPTPELARVLPFRSDAADDENVRQVVRRARRAFAQLGIDDLIVAAPGRGYRITWELGSGTTPSGR